MKEKLTFSDGLNFGCGFFTAGFIFSVIIIPVTMVLIAILTTILGNVSMAKNRVAPEDETFDLLNEAEMASKRAQELTRQLLTFAKGGAPVKKIASIKKIVEESSLLITRGSKSRCKSE